MIFQKKYTFTSSDVIESSDSFYVTITHNIGHTNYIVSVRNNNNEIQNSSNLFVAGDSNVRIYVENAAITGIWTVDIYYSSDQEGYAFKRLFEQPLKSNLSEVLNYKFAFADSNGVIKNITVADLKTMIQGDLSSATYCLRSNNLSDLSSTSSARTNLDVYSKDEINTILGNMYPVTGYIANIGSFQPASGLTAIPTVDIYVDFSGFSVNLVWNVPDSVTSSGTSGLNIGYFDVTPVSGHTLNFNDNYTALYIYYAGTAQIASHFGVGQLSLVPTTLQNNTVRFQMNVWKQAIGAPVDANVECNATTRCMLASTNNI